MVAAERKAWKIDGKFVRSQENVVMLFYRFNVSCVVFLIHCHMQSVKIQPLYYVHFLVNVRCCHVAVTSRQLQMHFMTSALSCFLSC